MNAVGINIDRYLLNCNYHLLITLLYISWIMLNTIQVVLVQGSCTYTQLDQGLAFYRSWNNCHSTKVSFLRLYSLAICTAQLHSFPSVSQLRSQSLRSFTSSVQLQVASLLDVQAQTQWLLVTKGYKYQPKVQAKLVCSNNSCKLSSPLFYWTTQQKI